jgi:hypothetical protein
MTNAQIRIEIAKLEEIRITCSGNPACFNAIGDAITALKTEMYKDNPSALKLLKSGAF